MPRWGIQDVVSNTSAQKELTTFNVGTTGAANGTNLYQNTTPGAVTKGQIVGLYGMTKAMNAVPDKTNAGIAASNPGWQLVRQGTGFMTGVSFANLQSITNNSVVVKNGGIGYNNTDIFIFGGFSSGGAAANASPVTNTTGGVLSLTFAVNGNTFSNVANISLLTTNSTSHATNTSLGTGFTYTVASVGGLATGNGYSNGDVFTFSNASAVNATASPITNATGGIVSLNFTSNNTVPVGGSLWINSYSFATRTANSTNGAANSSVGTGFIPGAATFGGRAGRIQVETLVAMKTFTSACSTPLFPNT